MKSQNLENYINEEFLERKKTPKDLNKWIKELYEKTDKEFIKLLVGVHKKENISWKKKDEILVKRIDKLNDARKKLKESRIVKPRKPKDTKKITDVLAGKVDLD
jgi:hypothetical protein